MNLPTLPPTPGSAPRTHSLLHRLQHAPDADKHDYIGQLMLFLEDPPPGTRDRWKEAAEMCERWGVVCTGASVWRLYRSHFLQWRLRLMQQESEGGNPSETAEEKLERLVAQRTLEILGNPQAPPTCLLSLARLEQRKEALAFAREKHRDDTTRLKGAFSTLMDATSNDVDAQTLALRLRDKLLPGKYRSEATVTKLREIFRPDLPAPSAAVAPSA